MKIYIVVTKGLHYAFTYAVMAKDSLEACEKIEKKLCKNEKIYDVDTLDYLREGHFLSVPIGEE